MDSCDEVADTSDGCAGVADTSDACEGVAGTKHGRATGTTTLFAWSTVAAASTGAAASG